ncbi:hypothetical protein MBAV_001537 [Candidatus Magnetobacterium bavaricum]|uniref:Uncharacterized protein n=1 Tax=Candidatus Magnetobacterium bavaricum TaxID=29290 RepID=A0A0F3GWQ0_9BACT|nr:hypothetical protein MBAV_001537 [Candidatus Magnetobacterium bavaricum]
MLLMQGFADAKVAVTLLANDIATVQVELVPVQSPLQPVNVEPVLAVAVRVTDVSVAYMAVPVLPLHVNVPVDVVTEPVPVPAFVTVSEYDDCANVAVTFLAADIVTVQVGVDPVQSPLQPVKVEIVSDVAVRVTDASALYVAVPVLPLQVNVPVDVVTEPEPDFITVR